MGWAFGGPDDLGREIGYGVIAECDFLTCIEHIDRGLGYLCGNMHCPTEMGAGCGRYFCGKHLHDHDCPENYGFGPDECEKGNHDWVTNIIPSTPDQPPGERVTYCDECGAERTD